FSESPKVIPGCRGRSKIEAQAVAFEAARTALEPDQRAFGHRGRAARIFLDCRADRLTVPVGAVLHVEHRVEAEIAPLLAGEPDPFEPLGDAGRASRRGQLD